MSAKAEDDTRTAELATKATTKPTGRPTLKNSDDKALRGKPPSHKAPTGRGFRGGRSLQEELAARANSSAPDDMTWWAIEARSEDRMEVYHAVQAGFPLISVMRWLDMHSVLKQKNVLSKIIGASDRTLARWVREPDKVLSPEQSTRALYYAEVMQKATEVLGSSELAEEWIAKPARGLDGEVPIDLIANSIGYELVNDFLGRMEYGVY